MCDTNDTVISGGFERTSGTNTDDVITSRPNATYDGWTVAADGGDWTVFALCADTGS
jgi:hypothetical protein